ncbi:MAG: uridine kinase [Acidimicrobiaceae bacterium]|nr:uridine kinase [Acidimicrobiaceae bacterium]MYE76598.1 uridine kinase [Acidimicrobiaceae bacterium]MYH44096.1 uridine kinase [Acidimicrobiaceae bacterium]MYI54611.1 uridine kinase [Acidimicrobiaceae bacterium]MYJ80269.1 uridine kinase [Acidimicrobiaceae bacterium]
MQHLATGCFALLGSPHHLHHVERADVRSPGLLQRHAGHDASTAGPVWCRPVDVFVFGICGGSGAGKTTLTRRLVPRLGPGEVSVLAFDAYYRDLSHLSFAERRAGNFDHPDSLDGELFLQHLDALKQGIDVDVPVYDFSTHTMTGHFERVEAAPLLLVEGILLLAFEEVAERLDYSIFMDVPEDVRLHRRIHRDVTERGRPEDHVRRQFAATVAPMHDACVQPNRHRADRIVSPVDVDQLAGELVAMLARVTVAAGPGILAG